LALAITLYFFAAIMFKEVLEKEHEEKEFDEKVHKYGYITILSLESVENATVLAALTLNRYQWCISRSLNLCCDNYHNCSEF
jgi:hypothetical protein